uniref:Uncharacterized protein n=1 Tax=Mycena chlorophos TaxID=658473 RepID=A0ABQ0KYK6_MYCCL|nr:predicted protein [Mycena chlorophos]
MLIELRRLQWTHGTLLSTRPSGLGAKPRLRLDRRHKSLLQVINEGPASVLGWLSSITTGSAGRVTICDQAGKTRGWEFKARPDSDRYTPAPDSLRMRFSSSATARHFEASRLARTKVLQESASSKLDCGAA